MQPDNSGQIPQQQHVSLSQVSAKEFAAKFRSKRECYNFLAGECEVYLPPYGKCLLPASLLAAVLLTRPFLLQITSPFTTSRTS